MDLAPILVMTVLPVLLIAATFTDLFSYTIPNRISVAVIVLMLPMAWLVGMSLDTLWTHVATALVVLALGYGLFRIGAMGGGDAKLLAGAALWLGPMMTPMFLAYVSIFGGLFTLILMRARSLPMPARLEGVAWIARLHSRQSGIPYCVAIGPVALYQYQQSPWWTWAMTGSAFG